MTGTDDPAADSPAAVTDRDWNQRYRSGDTPWDSGRPSVELRRVLEQFPIPRGRALELGCGTGTNAVYLAQQGFQVTAVDCAAPALELARAKGAAAGVEVDWVLADVQNFGAGREPFEFVFDRGCYHCCRRVDLAGYLQTHRHVTRSGAWFLVLAGNPDDGAEGGPPRVRAAELTAEFEPLYQFHELRAMHFEDPGGVPGPPGWSCLLRRRSPCSQASH